MRRHGDPCAAAECSIIGYLHCAEAPAVGAGDEPVELLELGNIAGGADLDLWLQKKADWLLAGEHLE